MKKVPVIIFSCNPGTDINITSALLKAGFKEAGPGEEHPDFVIHYIVNELREYLDPKSEQLYIGGEVDEDPKLGADTAWSFGGINPQLTCVWFSGVGKRTPFQIAFHRVAHSIPEVVQEVRNFLAQRVAA